MQDDSDDVSCIVSFTEYETGTTFQILANQRTNGFLSGTRTFVFSDPYGFYHVTRLSCTDALDNTRDISSPMQLSTLFGASFATKGFLFDPIYVDGYPPSILEVGLAYDEEAYQLNATVRASDDASGVRSCAVEFRRPATDAQAGMTLHVESQVSTPRADVALSLVLTLPVSAASGQYDLISVECTDASGRSTTLAEEDIVRSAAIQNAVTRTTPGDEADPVILGLRLELNTSSVVDTSLASHTVRATVAVSDDYSIPRDCDAWLESEASPGTVVQLREVERVIVNASTNLVSFSVEGTMPRYSPSGTWRLGRAICSDAVFRRTEASFPFPNIAVGPLELTQVGRGDVSPPEAISLTATPSRFSTAKSDVTVSVELVVRDDLSGVDRCTLFFRGPRNVQLTSRLSSFGSVSPEVNFTQTIPVTIPRYSSYALHCLDRMVCADGIGRSITYEAGLNMPPGVASFVIEQTSAGDVEAPRVHGVYLSPTTVDTAASVAVIDVRVDVSDDFAGVEGCTVVVAEDAAGASDAGRLEIALPADTAIIEGYSRGNLSASFTLPQYLPKGTWSVRSVKCDDNNDRLTIIGSDDFFKFGLIDASGDRIQVEQVGDGDFAPPVILDARFAVDSIPYNASRTEVTLLVTVTDDVSGIASCTAAAGFLRSGPSREPPTLAGTVRVPFNFFPEVLNGDPVPLVSVTCRDRAGFETTRTDFEGVALAVTGFDSQAPEFESTSITRSGGAELGVIQTDALPLLLEFTAHVVDTGAVGVSRCKAQLAPLSRAHMGSVARADLALVAGTRFNGTWHGRAVLPAGAPAGQYLRSFWCEDYARRDRRADNYLSFVTVSGRGNADVPRVTFQSPQQVTLAANGTVSAVLKVESDSPMLSCFATLRHSTLDSLYYGTTTPLSQFGAGPSLLREDRAEKATLQALKATLPPSPVEGGYYVDRASCSDVWGLSNRYEQSFLGLAQFPLLTVGSGDPSLKPSLVSLTVSANALDLLAGALLNVTFSIVPSSTVAPVLGCVASWERQEGGELESFKTQAVETFDPPVSSSASVVVPLWVPPTYSNTDWRLKRAVCWDVNGVTSDALPSRESHRIRTSGALDLRSPNIALAGEQLLDVEDVDFADLTAPVDAKQVFYADIEMDDDASGAWRCQGRLSLRPPSGQPSELPLVEAFAYSPRGRLSGALPRRASIRLAFPLPPPGAPANVATRLYLETVICLDGAGRAATLLGKATNVTYTPPATTSADAVLAAYTDRLRAFAGAIPARRSCAVTDTIPPVIRSVQPEQQGGSSLQGPTRLTLYVHAVDEASGVDSCHMWLEDGRSDRVFRADMRLVNVSGSQGPALTAPHTFMVSYALPRYMSRVAYSYVNISCSDGAGNVAVVHADTRERRLRPNAELLSYTVDSGLRDGDNNDMMLGPRVRHAQLLQKTAQTAAADATLRAAVRLETDQRTPRCRLRLCSPASAALGAIPGQTGGRSGFVDLVTVAASRQADNGWLVTLEGTLPRLAQFGFWSACELACDYDVMGPAALLHGLDLTDIFSLGAPGVFQEDARGDGLPPAVTSVQSLSASEDWRSATQTVTFEARLVVADAGTGLAECVFYFALTEANDTCAAATAQATSLAAPATNASAGAGQLITLQVAGLFDQAGTWAFEGIACADRAGNRVAGPRRHLLNAPEALEISASSAPLPPKGDGSGGGSLLLPVVAALVVILVIIVIVIVVLRRRRRQQGSGASKRSSTSVAAFGLPTAGEVREARSRSVSQRHRTASQLSSEAAHDLAILR